MTIKASIIGFMLAALAAGQTVPKAPVIPLPPANFTTTIHADLPPEAANRGVTGDVFVSVRLGQDGRIVEAKVVKGPAMLRTTALNAVLKQGFRPYRSNGRVRPVVIDVIVRFPAI